MKWWPRHSLTIIQLGRRQSKSGQVEAMWRCSLARPDRDVDDVDDVGSGGGDVDNMDMLDCLWSDVDVLPDAAPA